MEESGKDQGTRNKNQEQRDITILPLLWCSKGIKGYTRSSGIALVFLVFLWVWLVYISYRILLHLA